MLTPQTFKKHLNENDLPKGTPLYLGISGGADSMVLYDLIKKTLPDSPLTLLHVNYQLRKEAQEETDFLKKMAQKDGVPFVMTYFPKTETFSEEAGRTFRYDFFKKEMKVPGVLLTAHHLNDLAETFFMKLTRGTRLENLRFLSFQTFGTSKLYRPLLPFSKDEIYQYAKYHQLTYFEDSSNEDLNYQRNRYRKKLVPLFLAENPHFLRYLYELNDELKKVEKPVVFDFSLKRFLSLSSEKKHTYLKQWLQGKKVVLKPQEVLKLEAFLQNSQKNYFQINMGYLKKEKDTLVLLSSLKDSKGISVATPLFLNQWSTINDQEKIGYFDEEHLPTFESGQYEVLPVKGEIPSQLWYRSRQTGDKIKLQATGYTKKLNRYLIDKKIPVEKRETIKVIATENQEILWILPDGKSYLSYLGETDKITYRLIYNKKV